jgi:hypothetical protein
VTLPCSTKNHGAVLDGTMTLDSNGVAMSRGDISLPPMFCARHDELADADLARAFVPGGVLGRSLKRAESNRRPRRGRRVTTFQTYKPERLAWRLDSVAADILSEDVFSRTWPWESPSRVAALAEVVGTVIDHWEAFSEWKRRPVQQHLDPSLDALLAHSFRDGALVGDAFERMARWRLPSLARLDDTPAASALRASFWVRSTIACPSSDALRAFHPEGLLLQRPPYRRIRPDDMDAARVVLSHAQCVVLGILANKRFRAVTPADDFLGDWTIVRTVLGEGVSARVLAQRLGLNHAGVAKRYRDAIAAIADSVGPVRWPLSIQTPGFIRRGEGPERRTDKPALLTGPGPAFPKLPRTEERRLGQAALRLDAVKVPPGCAIGYPPNGTLDIDAQRYHDADDAESEAERIVVRPYRLWHTEGHVKAQRAARWRDIAKALPAGSERNAALANERTIARVLGDTAKHERDLNPYHPTSKPEARFTASWLNVGLTSSRPPVFETPRDTPPQTMDGARWHSTDIDDDNFAGPVKRCGTELVPRHADSSPFLNNIELLEQMEGTDQ